MPPRSTLGSTLGTLPNLISCSRLVFAAGFVVTGATEARVGLIGIAAVSDFLDGWVARRVNATSRWGAMLDPIADRVFVLTVVGTLLFADMLTTGESLVLIMRDLATAIGFVVARIIPWLRPVPFQARVAGKVVTVLQMATLATVLVLPAVVPWLLALVAIASVLSIVDYTLALWRARVR
jgi:CDP-diacylglycerol--glycerol-3-phosphate 3-phosphatidyltransferase